jgi:hypothetical protein
MGNGKNYLLRFRHLLLQGSETRELTAYNQVLILIEPANNIKIESDVGVYDLNESFANELQYEHRGRIKILNLSPVPTNVRFLQAIPNNTDNANSSK